MRYETLRKAYQDARDRNYDKIYWAIDLHGTCFESTFKHGEHIWHPDALEALRLISWRPESRIIIWTSINDNQHESIRQKFADAGVNVHYINENPEITDTRLCSFGSKFYFTLLLDDKAGFDPIKTGK